MGSKNGIIFKVLSIFESGLFIKILSLFITGLWIAGIILTNAYVILIALFFLVALSMVLYMHRDNLKKIFHGDSTIIVEDERTQLINEKSATMTLGILTAIIIWVGIVIVALRTSYPQYLQIGYTLFAVTILCFILYFSARTYYSRKY
jgi:uncharacterized membrane protein